MGFGGYTAKRAVDELVKNVGSRYQHQGLHQDPVASFMGRGGGMYLSQDQFEKVMKKKAMYDTFLTRSFFTHVTAGIIGLAIGIIYMGSKIRPGK